MPPMLQIQLLGGFDLSYGDQSLTGAASERLQSLLAYLALNRQKAHPRQHLAALFWTDSNDTQARTNLRKELYHLRQNLPDVEQILRIEPKTLSWSPTVPFTLDVIDFENAAEQDQLEPAIALYRGELLPQCDDDWITPERDRLQQLYVRVLEQLIERFKGQQDYRLALNYAQQLLRVDPLNESTYCTLMRLHDLSGDRANALQVYHRCMTMLREELGIDPSPTTRKLYEQLLREEELPPDKPRIQQVRYLQPSSPPQSSLPLVGRSPEWSRIQDWASSATQVLLLSGEPGIGKTRLLEELRTTVPVALWGRGFAAEMVRPYGIWIDALRSVPLPQTVPAELGFLLPEFGQPVKAPPDRSHLFDAVVQLLADWTTQTPLLVILDDIQWMDEASSALLHYASRLLSHLPVKFACTARSGELSKNVAISQVLQSLRREQRLNTIELQPFDRGNTAELICKVNTDHSFDLSLELIDQVFQDSGGNPLFVLEIARALSQKQSHYADNLEALIHARLQQLDDQTRDLLPWAAALGRSFKPARIAQVVDYPLPQLLTAIAHLEQQSMIRPSTAIGNELGYDFAHDVVRQVVYEQMSEPCRQLVHLQIAHKLNQLTTPDNALAGEIAHHARLGGDHVLAASSALLAAERCLKLFAYAEAAVLAQRGVQSCQWLDRQTRVHLQLRLLRVWATAGVTGDRVTQIEAEVRQLMAEASRLGSNDDEAIAHETLSVLYYEQGNYAELHQHSLRSTEVSRAASPATAARVLGLSGSCLTELGQDMIRGEAILLEAQSLASRVGLEQSDIYGGLGAIELHKAHYDAARAFLQRALQLAQRDQDRWRECNCLTNLIMTELEAGDANAALSYCEAMTTLVAQIEGKESESAVAAALMALAHYQLQRLNSELNLEAAIVRLKQLDIKRMQAYILIGAAEVNFVQEQFELAAVRAEEALQMAQIMKHPSEIAIAWALLIQAVLALGETDRATALFETLQNHIDLRLLSVRARSQVDHMMQQLKLFTSN
ncbi:AAA family ATPase [Cyanobacteria bacterium FACHB-63]|nr:AAA family ATPase [Cyanobacteria bacterium FACHB-63]